MGNCHPSETNVNLGFDSLNIEFLGVTISHVTLSCSQYLYNSLQLYVAVETAQVSDMGHWPLVSSHIHQNLTSTFNTWIMVFVCGYR